MTRYNPLTAIAVKKREFQNCHTYNPTEAHLGNESIAELNGYITYQHRRKRQSEENNTERPDLLPKFEELPPLMYGDKVVGLIIKEAHLKSDVVIK